MKQKTGYRIQKSGLLLIVLFSITNTTYALNRLGPPISELKKGQSSLGFEFTHNNEDLKYKYGDSSIESESEINLFMGDIGFNLYDKSEIHLKLGANKAEDSDTGFAWSAASKSTLAESNNLKLGLVSQVSGMYSRQYGVVYIPPFLITIQDDIEAYEYQIGFGPCLDYNDLSVYAYPMFHFIDGDDSFGVDIEETDNFGICAGLTLKPGTDFNINIEGQFVGDSYSIGSGFIFKFGSKKPVIRDGRSSLPPPEPGRTVLGYRATIDPATRKPVTNPVYEEDD